VLDEGLEQGMHVGARLLVWQGEHLLDEPVDRAVFVTPRRIDSEEEVLEERALARRCLQQSLEDARAGAKLGVHHEDAADAH
jgi:hypothetical protein